MKYTAVDTDTGTSKVSKVVRCICLYIYTYRHECCYTIYIHI